MQDKKKGPGLLNYIWGWYWKILKMLGLVKGPSEKSGELTPPCEGGKLLCRSAFWKCIDGYWMFVEVNSWECPPDRRVVDSPPRVIRRTKSPC